MSHLIFIVHQKRQLLQARIYICTVVISLYKWGNDPTKCGSYIYCFRGVSGFLKGGGQVVMQVVMLCGAVAGGAFYSAKKGWGAIAPCPPSITPLCLHQARKNLYDFSNMALF